MTGNRYKYILQTKHHMNMTGNRYKYILQTKHHMNMTGSRYKYILQTKHHMKSLYMAKVGNTGRKLEMSPNVFLNHFMLSESLMY